MTTIAQWLAACPLPKNEARMLLQHQTGFSRSQLITRDGDALSAADSAALDALAARRLAGEPMAYILGRREFYGREFAVSPAVLIPRPETEHLLEAALAALPEGGSLWDLGTGSGIIAVSAKLERPDAAVRASDISADALAVARNNARTLGAAIEWALGSWFDAAVQDNSPFRLPENSRFDVIVSNPPYIEAGDAHLAAGDLRFEPQGALTDFADGLSCIRAIAAGAGAHLKSGGRLLFEHGYNQGAAVRQILSEHGYRRIETLPDLAGLDRVTSAQAALNQRQPETQSVPSFRLPAGSNQNKRNPAMPLRPFQNRLPAIDAGAYIDPAAVLIGDVTVGADSSVWPLAVLRGDVNSIRIGRRSNIQDLSMLHVSHKTDAKPAGSPLLIGDDVTVGHRVTLHGCTVGNRVLVGMDSTVLDDAVIEDDVIIGAGSLVPPRKRLESGYLYMGSPAKAVRPLTDAEKEHLRYSAAHYARLAAQYLAEARS